MTGIDVRELFKLLTELHPSDVECLKYIFRDSFTGKFYLWNFQSLAFEMFILFRDESEWISLMGYILKLWYGRIVGYSILILFISRQDIQGSQLSGDISQSCSLMLILFQGIYVTNFLHKVFQKFLMFPGTKNWLVYLDSLCVGVTFGNNSWSCSVLQSVDTSHHCSGVCLYIYYTFMCVYKYI